MECIQENQLDLVDVNMPDQARFNRHLLLLLNKCLIRLECVEDRVSLLEKKVNVLGAEVFG